MSTLDTMTVSPQMRDFDKLCKSDDLSLIALQEKVNLLSAEDIKHISDYGSCLQKTCMNSKVTLEIIEYLLDVFPRAISNGMVQDFSVAEVEDIVAYLLHCACYNKDCPDSVIRLLSERYPLALEMECIVEKGVNDYEYEDVFGLPLHYYLSRNKNVNIEIVKIMVEMYPTSLTISDEENACLPLHALLLNGESTHNLYEILIYLIEMEPSSIRMLDKYGNTPLNLACMNSNVNLDIFQLLYNEYPEAIRIPESSGWLPIHELCLNSRLDDTNSLAILQFMLNIDPTLVRERNGSHLPIYHAVMVKSKEFCKVLVDAYPESVSVGGSLPIHYACMNGDRDDSVETIQHLLELYPEGINTMDASGMLPIHFASMNGRDKTIELLLKHDPDTAKEWTRRAIEQKLPLHLVCSESHGNLDAFKVLYDAYPKAIHMLDGDTRYSNRSTPLDYAMWKSKTSIVNFIQDQHEYVGETPSQLTARMEIDDNGWTRLHYALQENAPLGTIKLLSWVSPPVIRMADNQFAFPLHLACEFSSEKVVRYLVGESNKYILGHLDTNKDSILHYACRGGNCEVVKYLLTNHASLVSSAVVNGKGELPLHLLCEAGKDKVLDIDSVEYIETIWLMLLANPETVVGV